MRDRLPHDTHEGMAAVAVDDRVRELIDGLIAEKDALLRVARAVARGADPGEVFALVAREVAAILRVEAGIVWRFGPEGSEVVGTHGSHKSQLGVVFPASGDGAVAVVARTGRPARARYERLPGDDPTAARVTWQGYTSGVAAPLSVGGTLWGAVLAATTGVRELPGDTEARLGQFAELASLAIANAQARQDLALRATIDDLTEALNQGEFRAIRDELRGEDLLARVGGEEFAVILPETTLASAVEAAERARHAVAIHRGHGLPPVTVSAGSPNWLTRRAPSGCSRTPTAPSTRPSARDATACARPTAPRLSPAPDGRRGRPVYRQSSRSPRSVR